MSDKVVAHSIQSYRDEVRENALTAISAGRYDYCREYVDSVYDDMWADNHITGVSRDSYYNSVLDAKRAIREMAFDDNARAWVDNLFGDRAFDRAIMMGASALDVRFRCCALSDVWPDIRDAYEKRRAETK